VSTDTLTRSRRGQPAGGAAPIDPRLRRRRNEVARDLGRRRLRRLMALLVVVALGIGAGLAARSPLLDVDHVDIRGASNSGIATVRRATGIPLGRSMVSVDAAAAKARLLHLPWVAFAHVERRWPGTVVVTIRERTPVAVAGEGRAAVLVDMTGQALARATTASAAGLPTVTGQAPRLGHHLGSGRARLVRVLGSLPPDLRREVAGARLARSGIDLDLHDGIVVVWGDDTHVPAKSEAVSALLAQADRPTIARIDVSVPTAAAITRKS
jgi:cell division protein FtsQ